MISVDLYLRLKDEISHVCSFDKQKQVTDGNLLFLSVT